MFALRSCRRPCCLQPHKVVCTANCSLSASVVERHKALGFPSVVSAVACDFTLFVVPRRPMALDAEAWARSSLVDRLAACNAAACSLQALAVQHGANDTGRTGSQSHTQAAAQLFHHSLAPALAMLADAPAEESRAQDALLDVVGSAVGTAAVLLAAGASLRSAEVAPGAAANAAWAPAAAAAGAALQVLAPGNEGLSAALAGAPARQQRWLAAACSAAVAALQASLPRRKQLEPAVPLSVLDRCRHALRNPIRCRHTDIHLRGTDQGVSCSPKLCTSCRRLLASYRRAPQRPAACALWAGRSQRWARRHAACSPTSAACPQPR